MAKVRVAQTKVAGAIHVARDPYPTPAGVQKAVDRVAKRASRETAKIKAKRPAA
jgi:hypothetical protein